MLRCRFPAHHRDRLVFFLILSLFLCKRKAGSRLQYRDVRFCPKVGELTSNWTNLRCLKIMEDEMLNELKTDDKSILTLAALSCCGGELSGGADRYVVDMT